MSFKRSVNRRNSGQAAPRGSQLTFDNPAVCCTSGSRRNVLASESCRLVPRYDRSRSSPRRTTRRCLPLEAADLGYAIFSSRRRARRRNGAVPMRFFTTGTLTYVPCDFRTWSAALAISRIGYVTACARRGFSAIRQRPRPTVPSAQEGSRVRPREATRPARLIVADQCFVTLSCLPTVFALTQRRDAQRRRRCVEVRTARAGASGPVVLVVARAARDVAEGARCALVSALSRDVGVVGRRTRASRFGAGARARRAGCGGAGSRPTAGSEIATRRSTLGCDELVPRTLVGQQ
jgi:hypothetical protein